MLMIILAGLAYVICEGYIDDIIVHRQDDPVNLRRVFDEHCRQYRIVFNPKKSKIGLDRIDCWVGHQLDVDGIHFSAE